LTKLFQYAGAYTTATIDKATEVNLLIKEKDQRIAQLEEKETSEKWKTNKLEEQLTEEK